MEYRREEIFYVNPFLRLVIPSSSLKVVHPHGFYPEKELSSFILNWFQAKSHFMWKIAIFTNPSHKTQLKMTHDTKLLEGETSMNNTRTSMKKFFFLSYFNPRFCSFLHDVSVERISMKKNIVLLFPSPKSKKAFETTSWFKGKRKNC